MESEVCTFRVKLQNWTERDIIRAMEMYKEGKLSQRESSAKTDWHTCGHLKQKVKGASEGDRALPGQETSTKSPYTRYVTKRDTCVSVAMSWLMCLSSFYRCLNILEVYTCLFFKRGKGPE